jgi:hypothetical protein
MHLADAIRVLNEPTQHRRVVADAAARVLEHELTRLERRRGRSFSTACREHARDVVLDAVCVRGAYPVAAAAAGAWLARVYGNGLMSGARHARRTTPLSTGDDDAPSTIDDASVRTCRDRAFDAGVRARVNDAADALVSLVGPLACNERRGEVARRQFEQTWSWLLGMLFDGCTVSDIAGTSPADSRDELLSHDAISQRLTVARRHLTASAAALRASGVLSPTLHRDVGGLIAAMGERRQARPAC